VKFKIDENLPADVAGVLREAGFDACTVGEEGLSGSDDTRLIERIQQESRVFITLDLDFSDVRAYPPHKHSGIVVLRAKSQDKYTMLSLIRRLVRLLPSDNPANHLWIIDSSGIRIRE
jgi:predicted nuclease of predicted toxin-antitoxin system